MIPDRRLPFITIADCRRVVGEHFFIPRELMIGPDSRQSLVLPRQLAMTLARKLTGASTTLIGKGFGDRDHTTVLAALNRVNLQVLHHPECAAQFDYFHNKLEGLSAARVAESIRQAAPVPSAFARAA